VTSVDSLKEPVSARSGNGSVSPGTATTPKANSTMRQAKVAIATTLLERLLPEEQAKEFEEEDPEAQGSSKRLNVKVCARRVRFCGPQKEFRILDRLAPFSQSRGRWSVQNVAFRKRGATGSSAEGLRELFLGDMYHTFLDAPFHWQLLAFFGAYMGCFFLFALFWLWVAEPCGLKCAGNFLKAYMLSVETMATVGYGVSDPYMQGCWQGAVVLTVQCLLNILMGAWFIGVIFQGLSRPQSRASTILFSEKAVIRCINGAHYLMFRVCDLRIHHALIEPHVRCYCVMMQGSSGCKMVPMRIEQPDDELGGPLLLTIPTTIVHRIDAWSPLAPQHLNPQEQHIGINPSRQSSRSFDSTPRSAMSEGAATEHSSGSESSCSSATLVDAIRGQEHLRMATWPGTLKRQADCETGCRDSCVCPTCGAAFQTAWMLQRHCLYSARSDAASGYPPEICHRELSSEELDSLTHQDPGRWEIKEHFSHNYLEVVVIVEGIEPSTSSSLQARYSYVIGGPGDGDVAWDMIFAECCRIPREAGRALSLDLARFHKLEPIKPGQVPC